MAAFTDEADAKEAPRTAYEDCKAALVPLLSDVTPHFNITQAARLYWNTELPIHSTNTRQFGLSQWIQPMLIGSSR